MELLTERIVGRIPVFRRSLFTYTFGRLQSNSTTPWPPQSNSYVVPQLSPSSSIVKPIIPESLPAPLDTTSHHIPPLSTPASESGEHTDFNTVQKSSVRKYVSVLGMEQRKPRFAKGQEDIMDKLEERLEQILQPRGRWVLGQDGLRLCRTFYFKTDTDARHAINYVLEKAIKENHHPEIYNKYQLLSIRWTTHAFNKTNGPGITMKDIKMAKWCDGLTKMFSTQSSVKKDKAITEEPYQPF